MSEPTVAKPSLGKRGVVATAVYLVALTIGIIAGAYWKVIDLHAVKLNELGDFLAGAFGPLAIFWLVLGFFQQGRELQHSVEALNLQAEELRNSVEQQRAMVDITNRQLELDVEVREEQTKVAVSQELPYLQMQGAGSTGGGPGKRNFRFKIRNVGAPVLSGVLIVKTPGVQVVTKVIPYLEQAKEYEFTVAASIENLNPDAQPEMEFEITVENLRSQERQQVFKLKGGHPVLVNCFPEQP